MCQANTRDIKINYASTLMKLKIYIETYMVTHDNKSDTVLKGMFVYNVTQDGMTDF